MSYAYAVSDLHGNYNLWRQVIDSLGENETLFVLGDCADRGEAGWRIIKEALIDPRVVYVRGNHDQMLLDAWKSDWTDLSLWLYNGGEPTFNAVVDDLASEYFLKMLDKTTFQAAWSNGKHIVYLSHAGFTPTFAPSQEDLLWDRGHFSDPWPDDHEKVYVVFGHSPVTSKSCFGLIDIELNPSKTAGRLADGHKIDIDGRTILSHKCAMLCLDTLKERVFEDEV